MPQGQYSLADAQPVAGTGAFRLADAVPVPAPGFKDALVTGLKTFQPALSQPAISEGDALKRIKADPIGWLKAQLPLVDLMQRAHNMPLDQAFGTILGELGAGFAGAPPSTVGAGAVSSAARTAATVADEATSPATGRALVKVLPHGSTILEGYDALRERIAAAKAAAQPPAPPRVIRDPGERGIPPVLEYSPPEAPAPVTAPAVGIPGQLPSGRVHGGIQNVPGPPPEPVINPRSPLWNGVAQTAATDVSAVPVEPASVSLSGRRPGGFHNQVAAEAAAAAPEPAANPVMAGLDDIAVRSGFENFASAPKEIQPLLINAQHAENLRQARTSQAPVETVLSPAVTPEVSTAPPSPPAAAGAVEAPSELERQLTESLQGKRISPEEVQALDAKLKAQAAETSNSIEGREQVRRALRLGKYLQEKGIPRELSDAFDAPEWKLIADDIAKTDGKTFSPPSAETLRKFRDLQNLGMEEAPKPAPKPRAPRKVVNIGDLMQNKGRVE